MPVWVTLYIALLVISVPVGVFLLWRIEGDWLHPVGGLLSTLLSIAFVLAWWMPDLVRFTTPSTVLLYVFVLFWDLYTLMRMRTRLPEYLNRGEGADFQPDASTWLMGILLMVPAYYFGALVCLRIVSG